MKKQKIAQTLIVLWPSAIMLAAGGNAGIVTTPDRTNATGAGGSLMPVLSLNGRYVAFLSHANNLVTNDSLTPVLDLFVHDRFEAANTLVTEDHSGLGGGNGDSGYASFSSNGQFLVFASEANNLVATDTNNASDVFLRDLVAGTTHMVSVPIKHSFDSAQTPFRGSSKPMITPDARWVAFESASDNLVNGDTNASPDVFVRDTETATTVLVSVPCCGRIPVARERSWLGSITPEGRRIAFLTSNPWRNQSDVYVRDLQTDQTIWASSNLSNYFNIGTNSYWSSSATLSADGEHVAFKGGTNVSEGHLFYHQLETGTTSVLATNSYPNTVPAFSADGTKLAFEESGIVYLRDLEAGTNLVISVDLAGVQSTTRPSFQPVITPDGRFVAFTSYANDLTTNAVSSNTNIGRIYVRDVVAGVTHLMGIATNGQPSAFEWNSHYRPFPRMGGRSHSMLTRVTWWKTI